MNKSGSLTECPNCGEFFSTEGTMISESGAAICPDCFEKEQAKEERN